MAVMSPKPASPDFHFTLSSTAPSSPRLSGEPFDYNFYYTSTPTSPTRAAAVFSDFSTDFAFDSGRLSIANPLPEISTADELFDNGRIRPLQLSHETVERGRKRSNFDTKIENRARVSRSLSPLRNYKTEEAPVNLPKSDSGSWKWRLKDLLLFRSASEGRVIGRESRDPLRSYALFSSLFSSSSSTTTTISNKKGGREEGNEGTARRGGRRQMASAHAMHYAANRATAEEQRRKTPLAYQRHGFFGFIQYNPAIRSITKGFNGNSPRT